MAKVVHTCTGCVPIDASIIDTYVALVKTNEFAEAKEDERIASETERETAEAARFAAEAERVIAESERAAAEEIRAADHVTAVADHETAASDHETAIADHETAMSDHASVDGAADRANAAAAAAEHMVDIHAGPPGESAYEVAVDNGFIGTEEEWLASLKGEPGTSPEDLQAAVDEYLEEHPTISGTFLNSAKRSLLRLLEKVAYVDEHGADYIGELRSLLFLAPIDHIEAVYTQGSEKVYDIFDLDQLKENLVVMVHYTDGASEPTSDYTLSGTLQSGTSVITVSVLDTISQTTKTDTFNVSVTGTLKLYVLGDECTANSGGWQTKGFNSGAGSPVLTKESTDLLIKFAETSTSSVSRSWSTMNAVNLSAYSRILIEFEGDNGGTGAHGVGYLWCYWPTTLAEGTTQADAYGSDYSTNRNAICRFVDDPQSVYPRPVAGEVYFGNYEINTTHTNGYLSFNLNFYRQDGQDYVAGAYAKIRKVALAAE